MLLIDSIISSSQSLKSKVWVVRISRGIKLSLKGGARRPSVFTAGAPRLSDLMPPNAGINLHNAFSLQYGSCHLWLVESPDEIVQNSTDQSGLARD